MQDDVPFTIGHIRGGILEVEVLGEGESWNMVSSPLDVPIRQHQFFNHVRRVDDPIDSYFTRLVAALTKDGIIKEAGYSKYSHADIASELVHIDILLPVVVVIKLRQDVGEDKGRLGD